MAITIDGKVYRNLEEQVEKNKKDIAEFKEQAQSLSQFGIKVVSQVAVEGLIPSVIAYKAAHSDWEYGDTYAVGSEAPYKLYILTRADDDDHPEDYWFNIGQFPVAGPQGAQGIQGETGATGERGSKWGVGTSFPTDAKTGDLFLYSTTSQVWQYNGSTWDSVANIKGAQGIQGIQGIQGVQGVQGPAGPQGLQGPVGGTFTIKSTLSSTSLLPDPDESPRNEAYLIPVNDINHIYIIEEVDDALSWVDAGQFTGAQGEQGPQGPQGNIGPQGQTGAAALMFKGGVLESDTEPAVNTEFTGLNNSDFSRVPTGYDYCIAAISYNDGTQVHSYIANCQVTFSTQNTPQLKVIELVETTGAQGIQGEMGALNSSEEITYDSTSQSCLLASTVRNKINSALQTPAVAPTSHYIVGIDSSNAQENISIGSGLEIDNGALKATGGGGGGGLTEYTVQLSSNNNFLNICRKVNYYAKGRIWVECENLIPSSVDYGRCYLTSVIRDTNVMGLNFSHREDYYRYLSSSGTLEIDNSENIYSFKKSTNGTGAFNTFLIIQHNHAYNTSTNATTEEYTVNDYSEYISQLPPIVLHYENDSEITFT